jgi:hypothetical protein
MAKTYFDMIVPSLLKRWKRLESGLGLSAEAFLTLSKRWKTQIKEWLKEDEDAQRTRYTNPEAMDIYDTSKEKGTTVFSSDQVYTHQHFQLHLVP